MKYIDADKLKTWLENEADMEFKKTEENANSPVICHFHNGCRMQALDTIDFITSLQQERPEVDLEKEIDEKWDEFVSSEGEREDFTNIARHFYGLRNRALEKAARHVYESWMGGTMDDVRRDMVELGKVLNARKEE